MAKKNISLRQHDEHFGVIALPHASEEEGRDDDFIISLHRTLEDDTEEVESAKTAAQFSGAHYQYVMVVRAQVGFDTRRPGTIQILHDGNGKLPENLGEIVDCVRNHPTIKTIFGDLQKGVLLS